MPVVAIIGASPGRATVDALKVTAGNVPPRVPLATMTGSGAPDTHPDTIAGLYWDLLVSRDQAERLYSVL